MVTPIPSPAPTPVIVTTPAQFRDGTYTGIGKYSFGGGSVDYGVSLTITSGKISAASFTSFTVSGNGKYTRAQGDATLQKLIGSSTTTIDTVTGATGTSKAIQDAIDNALSQARTSTVVATNTVTTPVMTTPISTTVVTPNTHKNVPTATTLFESTIPTSYTAPNGKVYSIIALSTGSYIFERPDGTISSKKFATTQRLINYLDQNNPELQEEGGYIAPNGKQYAVIYNVTFDMYTFKRPDGSITSREFETKDALVAYLRENNPMVVAKPVVRTIAANTIKRTVVKSSAPLKTATSTVVSKPVTSTVSTTVSSSVNTQAAPQAKAIADRAAAQAAAKAQAAAAAKAAQAAAAAKVSTTTKAS